jgi:hypothetical protein
VLLVHREIPEIKMVGVSAGSAKKDVQCALLGQAEALGVEKYNSRNMPNQIYTIFSRQTAFKPLFLIVFLFYAPKKSKKPHNEAFEIG